MNRTLLLCIALYVCVGAQSADFVSPNYANSAAEYLRMPLHASVAALGTAVVASRDDLANAQYNPAILDALPAETMDVRGTFSILALDQKHTGANFAGNAGSYFVYGISYINFGVGGIPNTNSIGKELGTFSYNNTSIAASAAGRIMSSIAVGATVRYINEHLFNRSANGLGFDVGATFIPVPFLSLGICAQNIGSYVWWNTGTTERVTPTGRIGVCGMFLGKTLLVETDFIKTLQRPEEFAGGIQYFFLNLFYIRGGINGAVDVQNQRSNYPDYSLGVGMRHSFFGFDYACLIPPDPNLGLTHKISLCASIKNF